MRAAARERGFAADAGDSRREQDQDCDCRAIFTTSTTDNFNKFARLDFIDPQDKLVMVCSSSGAR
jgi:hypothetical protein